MCLYLFVKEISARRDTTIYTWDC